MAWPAAGNERWVDLFVAEHHPLSWAHLETSDSASEFLPKCKNRQNNHTPPCFYCNCVSGNSSTEDQPVWQHHWSHWFHYFDLTGRDLSAKGRGWMNRHIYNSTTWASIKGIQRCEKSTCNCNKGCQKYFTVNNGKHSAPVLIASGNKTAEWKILAVK